METAFNSTPRRLFIDGKWVTSASGRTFSVVNPADGGELTTAQLGEAEDIDRAVAAARRAFDDGRWLKLTPAERGRIIWRVGDLILEHADELAALESLDNGKPRTIARFADIPLAADHFHYMAGWVTKLTGQTIPISVPYAPGARFHAFTVRDPVGVAGQIIPWNFPLVMAAWKLAPALATGNSCILKPAEETPLSALRLAELIQEAGVPDGVVNVVTGFGDAGAALAAHSGVDKVAFTGSTQTGKNVLQAAGGNLKKVSLELGGKSPNIIFKDHPDLPAAIAGAASAIFFNQGETCTAGSRLLVEDEIFDQVIDGIVEAAGKIKVGPGSDTATEMGPLVSEEHLIRVAKYLDQGISEGATCVAGGKRVGDKGYFFQPTVVSGVRPDMTLVREEVFGPLVVADRFSDMDEVARAANEGPYGLAAGIWTGDVTKAHRLAAKLRAGTVWINCYNILDSAMPFGGFKQSGWGREMGSQALDLYTETKTVCMAL